MTPAPENAEAYERARTTKAALDRHHLDRRQHLYGRRRAPLIWSFEPLWPYSTAWSATTTLAAVPGGGEPAPAAPWLEGLAHYAPGGMLDAEDDGPLGLHSRARSAGGGAGDRFYDDNAWIGLALCRHHRLVADRSMCALARRVLAFVLSGWSGEPGWAHPGGIRWKEPTSSKGRNTCANGPTAELAVELGVLTADPLLIEWAVRIYDWVRNALLLESGLYADHLSPEGAVDRTVWTYNQGTMIGAGVLLAGATGEGHYLDQAEQTARASVARFGSDSEIRRQPPVFNAVFFRNLLLFALERPDPAYRELARNWADGLWRNGRTDEGLVAGGDSPVNATASLVEVEALLASSPPLP